MTTRRRPADIGDERGRTLVRTAGREVRDARRARDLSLRSVGTAVGLSEAQVSRIERGLVWSTEVPLPRSGDLRAWDVVLRGVGWRGGVEAETGPRDAQALVRRLLAKQRDGEVDLVVMVLRATAQSRRFLRDAGDVVRSAFPIASDLALQRLGRGESPGGNALVILPLPRR